MTSFARSTRSNIAPDSQGQCVREIGVELLSDIYSRDWSIIVRREVRDTLLQQCTVGAAMPEFAPLESQDVRAYWEHEAREFTPWLAQQIRSEEVSALEDALGLDLRVTQEEKSVGRYSVDILAQEVDENRTVVIENQLEPSDHDHLGKSIAYASGVDADIIVWIAPQFNDQHRHAIMWLNQNSQPKVDLFAVRLEVWRIADSHQAVQLKPIPAPSEWRDKAQRSDEAISLTNILQEPF